MPALQFLQDGNDRLSHARLLNVIVGVVACVLSGILVWQGKYSEYYFGLLLLYGAGQQTINKSLDVLGARFGLRGKEADDDGIRAASTDRAGAEGRAGTGRRGADDAVGEDPRGASDGAGKKTPEDASF